MRKLITILSFLIPVFVFSQNEQFIGTQTNIVKARGGLMSDSSYYLPLRDTNFIPVRNGAEILRAADGLVYKYVNGWNVVSSMVGDDYTIVTYMGTITAYPRQNSGLPNISSTDAYTVIQGAVNNLNGASQGSIGLTSGNYTLSNELTFTGIDGGSAPSHQIKMIGSGYSTAFIQTTSGKNAIVLKNAVGVVFKNFQIFVGSAAKSCILGDITGANSEISTWTSIFDDLLLNSQSTTQPALYLRNIFDISVPTIRVFASANHGIVIENNSTTTNYGNSSFGYVRASGSTSGTFAALKLTSVNTTKFVDHCDFKNFQSVGLQTYGVFIDQASNCTFTHVDIEASATSISLGSVGGGNGSRGIKFLGGGLVPATGGTGINAGSNSGGCDFNLYLTCDNTGVPINDASQFLPPNYYNVILDAAANAGNISITSPAQTLLIYRTTASQNTYLFFPTNTNGVTQAIGDSSTKVATDKFVNSAGANYFPQARVASFEAQGNGTTFNQLGLGMNTQGTTTARNVGTANFYAQQRKVGFISATSANSKAGGQGNPQFLTDLGFTCRAVFSIQAYNAGHTYFVGMVSNYSSSINGGSQTQCIGMYFNPGDANWSVIGAQGSAGTGTSLGASFPATTSATDVYDITIMVAAGGTTGTYKIVRLNTGALATGTISTAPQTGNLLALCAIGTNLATGVSASIDIMRMYVITPN
jgi:hypothetical protein